MGIGSAALRALAAHYPDHQVVVDFEAGIKTSKGDDRYAVLIIKDGEQCKFMTSAFEIKNVLELARDAEKDGQKIFPVENVIIRKRSFGDGKSTYFFEE